MTPVIIAGVIAVFIIVLIIGGIKQVRQAEIYVVERLGRYNRLLESGIRYIFPLLDKTRTVNWKFPIVDHSGKTHYIVKETAKIDLRETILDFPRQKVITKDNVTIDIDALLYFQITDPVKAVYEINNLPEAIEKLTQTTLRNVIGEMELDETLTSRDKINTKLRVILDEATDKWGVKINRVELKDISPPAEIRDSMEKQMKAERVRRSKIIEAEGKKRAAVLEAEGDKLSKITKAEGNKQSEILKAEGIATSRKLVANAEAEAIQQILNTTLTESIDMDKYMIAIRYMVAMKYMESLKDISEGKQTKTVFMPYEASGVLGSLGSLRELFDKNVDQKAPL